MNKNQITSLLILFSIVLLPYSYLLGFGNLEIEPDNSTVLNHSLIGNVTAMSSPDSSRAMYVNDFDTILGVDSLENILLAYAQSHEIRTLLLYDLHTVHNNYNLTDPITNSILADFIYKAKTSYGVSKIGATSENDDSFINVIDVYNNSRTSSNEKFDIYNLEFEFWKDTLVNPGGYYCENLLTPNGLPCTNAGGFQYFISVLQTMKNLADNNSHPITTEAYIGWPTASQADSIGDNLDLLRIHAYVSNPETAFSYTEERLMNYATDHPNVDVSIIFSAESDFMQAWLLDNSLTSAENIFSTDWLNGSIDWPSNINLVGFTYYNYTHVSDISLENCPSYIEVKDLTIAGDTTIYASSLIELNNVEVESPHQLTLIAPEVLISTDCQIDQGASLKIIDTDGCEND